MSWRSLAPSTITFLRLLAIPFLLYLLYLDVIVPFLALLLLAGLSDLLDGHLARKYQSASTKGAYFDTVSDFALVPSLFLYLAFIGTVPHWVPGLIVISFSLFLITNGNRALIYDPVGKYFGGFLFGTSALLVATPTLNFEVCCAIGIFFAASLISRTFYLFSHHSRSPNLSLAEPNQGKIH